MTADEAADIRTIIDWSYYKMRLDNAIQKIITIPAACQKVDNPVPRVRHPEWLHSILRSHDDTCKQNRLTDLLKVGSTRHEKIVDMENQQEVSILLDAKSVDQHNCGSNGLEHTEGALVNAREDLGHDLDAHEIGSAGWLALRKVEWRRIRQENKRIRGECSTEQPSQLAQRPKLNPRAGVGSFYVETAITLHSSPWHVVTLQERSVPSEVTAWVSLGAACVQAISLRIPRTIYVHTHEPNEIPSWEKVSRTLPRNAAALHTYEVTMSELDYTMSAGDAGKWLQSKNVRAVYHTQYSPVLRAAVQLGACCHMLRGVPRRHAHEGFDLAELKPSPTGREYLKVDHHDCIRPNLLSIYTSGTSSRGVLGILLPREQTIVLMVVTPKGTALSEHSRPTVQTHDAASNFNVSLTAVDNWEAAFGQLQRLLSGMQRTAEGSSLALIQTGSQLSSVLQSVPALTLLPTMTVPYCRLDGSWEEQLSLGGVWQPAAVKLALNRLLGQGSWWLQRLSLARYVNIPVGMLSANGPSVALDILFQRRLMHSGQISWLSPSPRPDLGGLYTSHASVDSLAPPEINNPGMYRTICVEMQLAGLAVNTILESNHVHALDRIDLGIQSAFGVDALIHASIPLEDEAAVCASAFRLVKLMLKGLMKDVVQHDDESADLLLMNSYNWLSNSAAMMHDPLLQSMLVFMMTKVWMQLLDELRTLGATVISASFSAITIATQKTNLQEAHDYLDFLIASTTRKAVFTFISLQPVRYWSTLLFVSSSNFGGVCHAGAQVQAAPIGRDANSARVVGCWNMSSRLTTSAQTRFRKAVDLLVGEPWSQSVIRAKEQDDAAPKLADIQKAAIDFCDNAFSIKVLEFTRDLLCDQEEPRLVRRHAVPQFVQEQMNPALEFCKMLCYLISLEAELCHVLSRLRRNLLKLLDVREFSIDAHFIPPGQQFVTLDAACEFCGHCCNLDICSGVDWICECCEVPYNHDAIEFSLMQVVLRNVRRLLHTEELRCPKCSQVKRCSFSLCCERCATPLEPPTTYDKGSNVLTVIETIAKDHEMPWLIEILQFWSDEKCTFEVL